MSKTKHLAFLAMFAAFAIILSYVESLIPINIGIPGMKIGLANLVIVFVLYYMKPWDAILVNAVRILISGLLFGSLFGILFSISGALVSFLVMWPLSRIRHFSIIGVSIAGGITHNIGQLIVAAVMLGTSNILYYAPFLLIAGLVTGLFIGFLAFLINKYIQKIPFFRKGNQEKK